MGSLLIYKYPRLQGNQRPSMKGQGTGLWLVAIGLIAVFMVATMIAPGMLNPPTGGTGDGGDNGTGQLTFQPPSVQLGSNEIDQDDSTEMTLRTIAASSTTGEGGDFIWVVSIIGANGRGNAIQMSYGDKAVQWFSGSNGLLVGVGPRFSQGPGAVPVEVSASFQVTPILAGEYTIEVWIAEASKVVTLDPIGLKAVSPTGSQDLTVNEKLKPDISVTQDLSGPSIVTEDKAAEFTLVSRGTATGKWNGSISDRIIILKSKIGTSDVIVRVGSSIIRMTDNGDSLTGDLQTVRPFGGQLKTESAEWSVEVQITFLTSGDYRVQGSCADSVSKKVLYTTEEMAVKVGKIIPIPLPGTNNSSSSGGATTVPIDDTATPSPDQPVDNSAAKKDETSIVPPPAASNATNTTL